MSIVKVAFSYTGGNQTWTVPPLVTEATFQLWGAPGGLPVVSASGSAGQSGATGAYAVQPISDPTSVKGASVRSLVGWIQGTTATTPGDAYVIVVGGGGGPGNGNALNTGNGGKGGFNGGAIGGYANAAAFFGASQPGGGGGGATDVRHGGVALANRILVAGGGGGAGQPSGGFGNNVTANDPLAPYPPYDYYSKTDAYTGPPATPVSGISYGGPGGSSAAGTAQSGGLGGATSSTTKAGSQGKGGSQSGGGAGGIGPVNTGPGQNGGLGVGGHGGNAAHATADGLGAAGGGGGGGHYGGGGGAQGSGAPSPGAGGGGGSNYASVDFSAVTSVAGVYPIHGFFGTIIDNGQPLSTFGSSNGLAVVNYDQPPNTPIIDAPLSGGYIQPSKPVLVDWIFASLVTGEVQSAFDLDYQLVGAGSWTSVVAHGLTAVSDYTFPANFFTDTDAYNVRVRVYDSGNSVSGYAETTFTADSTKFPSPPTITAPPNDSIQTSTPITASWTIDSGKVENIARVRVLKQADGTVLLDAKLTSALLNLSANPSIEVDASGWTITGTGTVAQSSTEADLGTHSLKALWDTADLNLQYVIGTFPTIPGESYEVNVSVTPVATGDPDVNIGIGNVGDSSPWTDGPQSTTFATDAPGTWTDLQMTFVAQAAESQIMVNPVTAPSSGDGFYLDKFGPEPLGSIPMGYADGSHGVSSYPKAWTGTTDKSISYALLQAADILSLSIDTTTFPAGELLTLEVTYSTIESLGVYSDPATIDFTANLDPPSVPEMNVVSNDDDGTCTVTYTTFDAPNPVIGVDIYRTDVTNGGAPIRLATMLPGGYYQTYVDETPATNTEYAYLVRANSASGFSQAGGIS